MALAVILLAAAGLSQRSMQSLLAIDPGLDTSNLLTLRIGLPADRCQQASESVRLFDQLTERIEALPGVESADAVSYLPLSGNWEWRSFLIEGREQAREDRPNTYYRAVTPGYLETLGARVVTGRTLETTDREGEPAVVIIKQDHGRTRLSR